MLLYPPGIGFIAAFFGCLYAGAVAVSACPPDPLRIDRSLPRLVAVARDAAPSVVLTTATMSTMLGSLSEALPELSGLRVMTTGDVPTDLSSGWEPGPVEAEAVALLQYTSGSTSVPKGVVLTHRNLMSNSELIFRFFGHSEESRGVSWLPAYHDMGLIGGILQPLYGGFPVTLMAPADFARQPLSWLQEIGRTRATTSGGPNFAYDLCVRKTTAAQRAGLDLSSWRVAFNGSEPIRAETMENFARAFGPAGFSREAFHPCYGLAEATLIATGGLPWSRRGVTSFDAARLRDGTAVSSAADTSSRRLVSCGFASRDRDVVIADPDTRVERAAGQVGEIRISGRGAAPSYWRRPAETRETFGAYLAGTSEGPFLRSGDLGFVLGRQLFVTGRIKDLIIIRGHSRGGGRGARGPGPHGCPAAARRDSENLKRQGPAELVRGHVRRRPAGRAGAQRDQLRGRDRSAPSRPIQPAVCGRRRTPGPARGLSVPSCRLGLRDRRSEGSGFAAARTGHRLLCRDQHPACDPDRSERAYHRGGSGSCHQRGGPGRPAG